MICPICKMAPTSNQLYGYYKGTLFIIKGFKCCGENYFGSHTITSLVYDQKKDRYIPIETPGPSTFQKFDHTRILISNAGVGGMH